MSDKSKTVDAELERRGFRLVRQGNHLVYRDAEGHTFVRSKTPSDVRASENQLSTLRRELADIPTSAEVDAQLPKQEKRKPGMSGAVAGGRAFNFYKGLARPRRPSIAPTPEASLKVLQGSLRSHDAYRFKATFVRMLVARIRENDELILREEQDTLENFDEAARIHALILADPDGPLLDVLRETDPLALRREEILNKTIWLMQEHLSPRAEFQGTKWRWEHIRVALEANVEVRQRDDVITRKLPTVFKCVADRLLRGASAAACREYIDKQLKNDSDAEAIAYIADLVEQTAAEIIAEEPPPQATTAGAAQ